MSTRLQQLLAKRDQLQARIRNMESKQKARERRLLTRKKILLGALLQEWMKEDSQLKKRVDEALVTFLKRSVDKEAFTIADGQDSEAEAGEDSSAA